MPAYHPGKEYSKYGPATRSPKFSGDHWFDGRNRFTPRRSPEISTRPDTAFNKEQSNSQGGNRRETRPPSHLVPDTAVRLGAGATALASVVTGAATWLVLQRRVEASPASSPPNSAPHLTLSELQMKHFLGKTLQLGNSTSTPPPTETPFPMGEVFLVYRIGQGDTLKTIAERFNLTLKELLTIPGIENVVLRPGETISIPFELVNGKLTLDQSQSIQPDTTSREDTKTPTPAETQVAPVTETAEATGTSGLSHTVQGEDTLGDIAWKYQTSVQAILAENPDIEDKDHVPRGTVLKLPKDAKLRPAEPSETANTPVSATASSGTPETVVNTAAAGEPQTSTQKPALSSSRARGTPPPPSVSSPSQDTPQVIPVPAPRPDKETVSGSEEQPSGTPPPQDILLGDQTAITPGSTVEPSGKPPEIVTPSSQSPAVADADEQGNATASNTGDATETNGGVTEIKTGNEMINRNGLEGQTVYLVYGQQSSHGSLGLTETAEEGWEMVETRAKEFAEAIGDDPAIALKVLNPVYTGDEYVTGALELASEHRGIVAPVFTDLKVPKAMLDRLFGSLPEESLKRLSIALDLEWFSEQVIDASDLNTFADWFSKQRKEAGIVTNTVPAFIFVYVIDPDNETKIIGDMSSLKQYYPEGNVYVVPIIDGFGSAAAKEANYRSLLKKLPEDENNPALGGMMEFRLRWGETYDKSLLKDIYEILSNAKVRIFASQ